MGIPVLKTARKLVQVTGINLVDETSELMVIRQFGKIIRMTPNRSAPPAAARGRVLRCPRLPPEFTTSAPSVRTSPATIALILYQSWIQIYRLCVPSNALRTSTDYTDRRSLVPREKPLKKRVLKPFLFPVRYHG